MSIKKAQAIVNSIDDEFGFSLVAYQTSELKRLKSQLEKFLALNVETDDLQDAGDELSEDEEWSDEDYAQIEEDVEPLFETAQNKKKRN